MSTAIIKLKSTLKNALYSLLPEARLESIHEESYNRLGRERRDAVMLRRNALSLDWSLRNFKKLGFDPLRILPSLFLN